MSEKMYAFLLRLYPARFRQAHSDAALQLIRDRFRDERGYFRRLRLWFDLLADLAFSFSQEFREAQSAPVGASVTQSEAGTPGFLILEVKPPRPEALFFGGLLSLAVVGAFAIATGHAGDYHPFRTFVAPSRPSPHLRPTAPSHPSPPLPSDGDEEVIGSASHAGPASQIASTNQTGPVAPPQSLQVVKDVKALGDPKAQDANKPLTMIAASGAEIDPTERQHVIAAAITNLKQHYFDSAVAQSMADSLHAHAKHGDDDAVKTGAGFAALLTTQMRDVSHDNHLEVVYSQAVLPNQTIGASAEQMARYRTAMEQTNCTIERVEMLPHSIGYLKLNSFPDASVCEAKVSEAMKSLNRSGAVILDLRDNGGGYGSMVSMLAAYFFDRPTNLYDPRLAAAEQLRTHSPVAGNKLADKPLYILTSGSTISAAEDFAYNMKMLHRATLVGETTRGSAHAGVFHRIDDHFGMGIPEVKAVNPFAKTDWEGVGVEPDVKVNAEDALATAEKLAQSKRRQK